MFWVGELYDRPHRKRDELKVRYENVKCKMCVRNYHHPSYDDVVSYKLISLYSHHHFLNYNLAFCLTSLCILIFLFYFHNKEKQKRSTLFSFSFSSESRNNLVYSGTDTEDQILGTRFLIKENHLWFFAKAGPLDSGKRTSIQ